MRKVSYISSLIDKTKIFIADCPSEKSAHLRANLMRMVRRQLQYRSSLNMRIETLTRKFPLEKNTWDKLLTEAPRHCEQLLRARGSDTLIWMKADRSGKRLKLKALSPVNREKVLSPHDIVLTDLEPIPVEHMVQYSPVISLFILAQLPVPDRTDKKQFHAYAAKIKELSSSLDTLLSGHLSDMPQNFRFILRRFQAWAWMVVGIAFEDTAKQGRAIRACESIIADWPYEKRGLEYGQTLSNLAALHIARAHLITGTETFEAAVDCIGDAQAIFSRTKYPVLWAQLQELRAEALIHLGERYCDTQHLEDSIHTLHTIKRIWDSQDDNGRLAGVQQRIGDVLHKLGRLIPGTERLEQACSAYHGAIQAFRDSGQKEAEGIAGLSLAQTLVDLGERGGSKDRLEDAVRASANAGKLLSKDKKHKLSCQLVEAHALTRLGCQFEGVEAESRLQNAIGYFEQILRDLQFMNASDQLHCLEYLALGLGHLGRIKQSQTLVGRSSEQFMEALAVLENNPDLSVSTVKGRLLGQLARNKAWLGRMTYQSKILDDAVSAFGEAIKYTDRDVMSRDWVTLQSELASTLVFAARHRNGGGADLVDQAIQAYHRALATLQRERAPLLWAQIKGSLAEALTLSGALGGGVPCLEMAIESYSKALEEWHPGSLERAAALNNMANVLADLGRREADEARLIEAGKAFSEAYDLYSSMGQLGFAEKVHDNLNAIGELVTNDFQVNAHRLYDSSQSRAVFH